MTVRRLLAIAANAHLFCPLVAQAQTQVLLPSGWGNRGNRIILIDDNGVRTELSTTTGATYP